MIFVLYLIQKGNEKAWKCFTQGTIVQHIISPLHPNVQCGGVVINASCDIVQKKIPRISMLSFMTLEDWILNEQYGLLLGEKQKEKYSVMGGG